MTLRYTVLFTRETEPVAIVATIPALDIVTSGATIAEAEAAATEAITLDLIGRAKHGEPILPEPAACATLAEIDIDDVSLEGVDGITGEEVRIAQTLTSAIARQGAADSSGTLSAISLDRDHERRLTQAAAALTAAWSDFHAAVDDAFSTGDPRRASYLRDVSRQLQADDADVPAPAGLPPAPLLRIG